MSLDNDQFVSSRRHSLRVGKERERRVLPNGPAKLGASLPRLQSDERRARSDDGRRDHSSMSARINSVPLCLPPSVLLERERLTIEEMLSSSDVIRRIVLRADSQRRRRAKCNDRVTSPDKQQTPNDPRHLFENVNASFVLFDFDASPSRRRAKRHQCREGTLHVRRRFLPLK